MYKKTLVILAILAIFLLTSVFSAPQGNAGGQQKGGEGAGILNMIPDLTDAQKAKIKGLLDAEKAQMKEIREKYRQEIEKVLTPQQIEALKKTVSAKFTDNMVARLNKSLNLSTQQQEQIKAIYAKYQDQFKSAKDKESKVQIMNKLNTEIKSVLTAEQKAKFDEMQNKFKEKMQNKSCK